MESQPQNPELRIILKTFTHVSICMGESICTKKVNKSESGQD